MRDPAQLAECLRCISTPGGTPQCDYTVCVYDCAEPVTYENKEFAALAEADGCFHSIDCDRIGLDAAELIEKLRRENKQFRSAFDKAATESAYFKAAFEKAIAANDDLFAKLTAMKAERDAAVADIELLIHNDGCQVCHICSLCDAEIMKCRRCENGRWRGVQHD